MEKTTGILLINLGTPDSPRPRDVYRYLIEFLTDGRVIDMPWLSRQLLVRGLIVPKRYRQSALAYQKIWTAQGSPLKIYGYKVKDALQSHLGGDFHVELGMRYQNPSISQALNRLLEFPLRRLLILPLFPQYASATTGSVHQKVMEELSRKEVIPETFFINHYATHPAVIKAFGTRAKSYQINTYDHFLFSFHGLPERHIHKVDRVGCCLKKDCCAHFTKNNQNCYRAQCYATTRAIMAELNLDPNQVSVSFQSRLGKEPWLQPYTSEVIAKLAHEGKKRVLVFSPAFVCDCLETIYEIGVEYAMEFKHAGGVQLDLVPGLNDDPHWIEALGHIIKEKVGVL